MNELMAYALTTDEPVCVSWRWLMENTTEVLLTLPNPVKYHIYTGQHIAEAWPYAYVLAAQGVYKLVDTPHFYASLKVSNGRPVAGLARWPEEGVLFRVPQIPATWLHTVLDHARKCGSGGAISRPIEQMYHFHFFARPGSNWLRDGEWRVAAPAQKASAGRVEYWGGSEPTVVLDLHSHHEMGAYFSSTDNRDEQGCRLYGVIGRIYSRPEIRLRLGVYGDFVELPANRLFENLGPFVEAL